ncbi:single-stranded DNA-binding protein [Streptomyces sp. GC420]|nr:single-stranded DNA-binding protein [Streptomyces sp. GC420]NBM15555.1 single-stranded DNA-binding protein [Streptomyces sp. GC420]
MNDAMVTVVGNVATKVDYRESESGPVARFRLAATSRRWDRRTEQWADGHTNFFTVWASKSLAANLAASVSIGEPLVVRGRLKVRDEEQGSGRRWFSADVIAVTAGHDLSRGTSAFRRTGRSMGGDLPPGMPPEVPPDAPASPDSPLSPVLFEPPAATRETGPRGDRGGPAPGQEGGRYAGTGGQARVDDEEPGHPMVEGVAVAPF